MNDQTELEQFAKSKFKILQYSSYTTIHILCGFQIVVVFFILLLCLITQQWSTSFDLENKVFWFAIALIFTLISLTVHAVTDIYATTVFIGGSVLFLAFVLLVMIVDLPQFWEKCTESKCEGWKQDIFYIYYLQLVLLAFICAAICYQEFRIFRLEGTMNRVLKRGSAYGKYSTPFNGGNRLLYTTNNKKE